MRTQSAVMPSWLSTIRSAIVFSNGAYSHRVALPEAAMDARLEALNHAARNDKDFSQFMSAVAQIG